MTWRFGPGPLLIAGPCVIENGDMMPRIAETLAGLRLRLGIPVCFKASFDKANRARLHAPRGPGLDEGLAALERVKRESGLPVLTDIHTLEQAGPAAQVADALQIPAFLCRQTDLLTAAGATGRPVNIKKGQWMAPEEMAGAVEKVRAGGSRDVAVTERGTGFGYGDLIVDMRSFTRMRLATGGSAVLFDATHAVQQPGRGAGGTSGGARSMVPPLLLAAAAAGADGFYLETHPDPDHATSDAATQWPLLELEELVSRALDVWHGARDSASRSTPASPR